MPANLEKLGEQLYAIADSEPALAGLDEREKDELVAGVAAEIANKDSYLPRLARSELERNLCNGLDACDPAGFSSGIKFSHVALDKTEYEDVSSAMREEFRNIDADNLDPEDELFKRAAARIAGIPYTNKADVFETALMADDSKLAAFGDAYAKAEAFYYDKLGELANIVVPKEKPRIKPAPVRPRQREKGLWSWVKRHWKAAAITGIVAGAGAYGAYQYWKDQNSSLKDTTPPTISDVEYSGRVLVGQPNIFNVSAADNAGGSGLDKVLLEVSPPGQPARNFTMAPRGLYYTYNFTDTGKEQIYPFRIIALDKVGLAGVRPGTFEAIKPEPTFIEKYADWAAASGVTRDMALAAYGSFGSMVEQLYGKDQAGLLEFLKLANANATLPFDRNVAGIVARVGLTDPGVPDSTRLGLITSESKLYNDLDITGFKHIEGKQAGGNYTHAILQNYTRHSNADIKRLLGCVELSPELFDCAPIRFASSDGKDVYITPVPVRKAWLTAEHMKNINNAGFRIEDHPEMLLGLGAQVDAAGWCGFDNPYGLSYAEKTVNNRTITPKSQDFRDLMMLQWDLYSQFAPQRGGGNLTYNRDFPWYNSTALTALYPDANEMKAALFWKFYIPQRTYSIKDQRIVSGVEGAKIDLQQSYDEYKTVMSLYPNGTMPTQFLGDRSPRFFYYDWLDDRLHHGLNNTVGQYVGGWDDSKVQHGLTITYDWVQNQKGMDQSLTNLTKFIAGYVRGTHKVRELEGIEYVIPGVLRMAGFPVCHVNIEPTPNGAANREWAVGLPPYVVDSFVKNFPKAKILFGPGYTFNLYNSDENSLAKDGVESVYVFLGDSSVYLKK